MRQLLKGLREQGECNTTGISVLGPHHRGGFRTTSTLDHSSPYSPMGRMPMKCDVELRHVMRVRSLTGPEKLDV